MNRVDSLKKLAQSLNCDPLILESFVRVESNENHWDSVTGRLIINFESGIFRSIAKKSTTALDDAGQASEWAAFEEALTIDENAAYQSISMGFPQILGNNFKMVGFSSAKAMFEAFNDKATGEEAAVIAFGEFIKSAGNGVLLTAVISKDFHRMAYYYNGRSYQADKYLVRGKNYAERMLSVYKSLCKDAGTKAEYKPLPVKDLPEKPSPTVSKNKPAVKVERDPKPMGLFESIGNFLTNVFTKKA